MTSKKKEPEPEFDIEETPTTSDGNLCTCTEEKGRNIYCTLHGG
jgi:hypothetical protein